MCVCACAPDRIAIMSVGKGFGFLIFSPTLVCIYFCLSMCVVELSLTPPCPSLLPTIFLLSPSIFYSSFALYHGHSRGLKGWYFPNAHWNMRRESFEYCLSMDNKCVRKNGFPWHDQLGSYSRIFPLNRSLFRTGGRNEGLGEILRTVDDTSFNHLRQQTLSFTSARYARGRQRETTWLHLLQTYWEALSIDALLNMWMKALSLLTSSKRR